MRFRSCLTASFALHGSAQPTAEGGCDVHANTRKNNQPSKRPQPHPRLRHLLPVWSALISSVMAVLIM